LVLSAILFGLAWWVLCSSATSSRIFMSIELMLNAVNLAFVAFSRALGQIARPSVRVLRHRGGRGGSGCGIGIIILIARNRRRSTSSAWILLKF
jgi:NADH-quinone oxidoreductase subunit K